MSKKKKITVPDDLPFTSYLIRCTLSDQEYCGRELIEHYAIIRSSDYPSDSQIQKVYNAMLDEIPKFLFSDGETYYGFIEIAPVFQEIEVETSVSVQRVSNGKEEKKYC